MGKPNTMLSRGRLLDAVLVSILLLSASQAYAHAVLVESNPADNAVLKSQPAEAVLRFNARIESGVSRFTLLDDKGRRVASTPAPKGRSTGPGVIAVTLPALGPGSYMLQYVVLATDGHATPGVIHFTVSGGNRR